MNFKKALTYIFNDPEWFNKILIPLLVSLIPLVGQMAVTGWMLELIRNVTNRVEKPLPKFDFGSQIMKGLKWMVVSFIYALPIILLYLLMFAPAIATSKSGEMSVIGILFMIVGGILILVFGIALGVIMPVAQANFAMKETIKSAFDFKTLIGLVKNNVTAWLMVIGGIILAGFIAPLGSALLVIGALITAFYAQTIVAHLSGQAYAMSQTKGGAGVMPY